MAKIILLDNYDLINLPWWWWYWQDTPVSPPATQDKIRDVIGHSIRPVPSQKGGVKIEDSTMALGLCPERINFFTVNMPDAPESFAPGKVAGQFYVYAEKEKWEGHLDPETQVDGYPTKWIYEEIYKQFSEALASLKDDTLDGYEDPPGVHGETVSPFFEDFNFKIQEDDFKLKVTTYIDDFNLYDLRTWDGGLLSPSKDETSFTFAYGYEEKDINGDKIKSESSQNASNYIKEVSNSNTKHDYVTELKNIIVTTKVPDDMYGVTGLPLLENANDSIPKRGEKLDINKVYNKIEFTIPKLGASFSLVNTWPGYVDMFNVPGLGAPTNSSLSYLNFVDYAFLESAPDAFYNDYKKELLNPINSSYAVLHSFSDLGAAYGALPNRNGDLRAINYYPKKGSLFSVGVGALGPSNSDIKSAMDNLQKRFAYQGDIYDPDYNRFANKDLINWTKEQKLNTYTRTTLLGDPDSPEWNKKLAYSFTPIQGLAGFSFNNQRVTNLRFMGLDPAQKEEYESSEIILPGGNYFEDYGLRYVDPNLGLFYFPYGENLRKHAGKPASDSVQNLISYGNQTSMNPSKLIGVKILKTRKPADLAQGNMDFHLAEHSALGPSSADDIVQTFFFNINNYQEEEQTFTFYDSQVRFGEEYYYTLVGVYEVDGNVYSYSNVETPEVDQYAVYISGEKKGQFASAAMKKAAIAASAPSEFYKLVLGAKGNRFQHVFATFKQKEWYSLDFTAKALAEALDKLGAVGASPQDLINPAIFPNYDKAIADKNYSSEYSTQSRSVFENYKGAIQKCKSDYGACKDKAAGASNKVPKPNCRKTPFNDVSAAAECNSSPAGCEHALMKCLESVNYAEFVVPGTSVTAKIGQLGALEEKFQADTQKYLGEVGDQHLGPLKIGGVKFNLNVLPQRRIFEVPMLGESVKSAIVNWPPVPPVVEFNPLEGAGDKIQIFFQEGVAGRPTIRPYITSTNPVFHSLLMDKSHEYWLDDYSAEAGLGPENAPLKSNRLYYQSQGDLKRIVAYRLDRKPFGTTKKEIYDDLIENGTITAIEFGDLQTGYVDSTKTNIKYYYTFISQDVFGLNSYPSIIYEAELVEDSGFVYPVINHFDVDIILKMEEKKEFKKNFSQYLRIEPSFIQKIAEYKPGFMFLKWRLGPPVDDLGKKISSLYTDLGGAGPGMPANAQDEYPKIKVRIRSKKTKRAFDLNLKYMLNIKEVKDEKELKKLSPRAKEVKKVTK